MAEGRARYQEAGGHLSGRSTYVDDWPLPEGTLHAAVVAADVAHGRLRGIDSAAALAMAGVQRVITAADIPGDNQIGDIVPDERLLAESVVKYRGKPVALVLADSAELARRAAARVRVDCVALPAITDVRAARKAGHTFGDERRLCRGQPAQAFAEARWVVQGEVDCHAQEHLYFETQSALAMPLDGGERLRLLSASQNPSAIQRFAAKVLALPMHCIEVEVPRLGGAFGGKEEQAKVWALLAALGAMLARRPVKLVLERQEDMRWTGKRHPYAVRYRIAADPDGHITAYAVDFLQDGGAVADLSTAVLERTLFHATNAYQIAHVQVTAISCRTHHPSNTAFRGFGAPQAVIALECAIDHLAREMGRPRWRLQADNLLRAGYAFDYGMTVTTDALHACWQRLLEQADIAQRCAQIERHNQSGARYVRGLALTPLCFGISFTATHLNQAGVLVNIYTDGSVGVAISAVEMGQGVREKMQVIVARCFALERNAVRVDFTNSSKTANVSPTAASVGTDLNGMALLSACEQLRARLAAFAAEHYALAAASIRWQGGCIEGRDADSVVQRVSWLQLVGAAYMARIDLVKHGFYATPDLYFDRSRERGRPFAYHVYGVSAIEATLDSVLGTYTIDRADVVYDLGQSLAPLVDLGQMEGGLVQGIGYATLEEIRWDAEGRLLTDSLATYKIPDLLSSPAISVEFIASDSNRHGPFSAKAVGEPPFLLGLGAYTAVLACIRAANPDAALPYQLPMTPEKALLALYPRKPC